MDKNLTALKQDAPTDARQVRSRKALNQALLALLAEKPFDELTIREISRRARTGYATFFRHFTTKDALLADLTSEPIADLLGRIIPVLEAPSATGQLHDLCAHVASERDFWAALLTGGAASIVRAEFLRQARSGAARFCGGTAWVPGELALLHGVSSAVGVMTWWLRQPAESFDIAQVATILHRMVLAPLAENEPQVALT